jgi:hypothetical protein
MWGFFVVNNNNQWEGNEFMFMNIKEARRHVKKTGQPVSIIYLCNKPYKLICIVRNDAPKEVLECVKQKPDNLGENLYEYEIV